MQNAKDVAKTKQYVRRGFDIEITLYNKMRAAAAAQGINTKDWLAKAIKRELSRMPILKKP